AAVASVGGIHRGASLVALEGDGDDRAREHHTARNGHEGEDHLSLRGGFGGRYHTREGIDRNLDYNLTPRNLRGLRSASLLARVSQRVVPASGVGEEPPVRHHQIRLAQPEGTPKTSLPAVQGDELAVGDRAVDHFDLVVAAGP